MAQWVEIIRLVATEQHHRTHWEDLKQVVRQLGREPDSPEVRLYQNAIIDNEETLIILWTDQAVQSRGSRLGLSLVELLKHYGLVHHSVWSQNQV